jgi:excisionase family DNA binding protein
MQEAVNGLFNAAFADVKADIKACIREEIRLALRDAHDLGSANRSTAEHELLTVDESATLARVTAATVRGWVKAGHLRRYGNGRVFRIRRSELMAFLANEGMRARSSDDEAAGLAGVAILSRKRR